MDYFSWPLTERNKNALAAFFFLYGLLLINQQVYLLTIVTFSFQEITYLLVLFMARELGKLKYLP